MNKFLVSTAALLALTSAAAAADLPARTVAPAPVAVAPTFSWNGFYIGVHGAWVRNDPDAVLVANTVPLTGLIPTRRNFYVGDLGFGGQAGFNAQFGQIVAGVEADATWTETGRTRATTIAGVTTTLNSDLDWLGTLRGRIGVSFPSLFLAQQSLYYVTGGLAYGEVTNRGTITGFGAPLAGAVNDTQVGFAVGIGSEHAFTNNISLTTQTLYYDLGDQSVTVANGVNSARYRFSNEGWVSRLGLNVRF